MSENYLPLNGKLTVPQVIYEGEPQEVTKEMVESLLLSEAALSETLAEGDMVPIVNTDESGHRSVAKLTTIDSLAAEVAGKIDIPEIPDSSIDICPLIIAQLFLPDSINSDVGGTCSISKNQTVGAVPKIDQQGIALIHQHNHLYHNRFKVTGSFDDTNSATIQFISNKIQIDTDLAPGILLYGSVADEIQKNQSTMVTENFFIGPLPKVNDAGYGLLEQGKKLYRVAYHISSISSNNLFTIVYDSEPELVGGDEVPYEPGLRSITKEFTISSSASKSGIICNLSDFGVDIEDVVSFVVHCKNNELLFLYSLIPPEYIKWNYPGSALDFSNVTFSVTITVKDYSSIGPSIVTDGIRMITKDFTVSTPQNVSFVSICNISDFGISNLSDVIGIIGYADRYAATWYSISSSGDIHCNYYSTLSTGSVDYKLSLIVKVPVVEEGPPIGEIISYMGTTAPNKFLICDGTAYNISDYPQLAEHFTDQFGSVNHFGGDGTTTFAVPDLRGEFLRGTGTATRNTGTGAEVGEHQDGTENLKYQTNIGSGGTAFAVSNANGDNLIVHNDDHITSIKTTDKYINYTGAKATSSETWYTSRPTNTAVLYCIRAKK